MSSLITTPASGGGGGGGMADPGANGVMVRTALNTSVARTITGTSDQVTVTNGSGVLGSPTISLAAAARYRQHTIVIDGQGSAPVANSKLYFRFGYAGTITKVSLLADVSGSIVLDVWKDTYANYPPTIADTITASAKPTLSSAIKSEDSSLTGWTVSFSAGDCFAVNVDSASTLTKATLTIETLGA